MYFLSSLLVEDGIRPTHLSYQSISVSFLFSLTLLRAFQFSRRLGTCPRGLAVHLVPRFLLPLLFSLNLILGYIIHLAADTFFFLFFFFNSLPVVLGHI